MNKTIPIMHCFNNNYVIPASVAFYSLLNNSDPECHYNLYVLHSDITALNQNKLKETINPFKNVTLEFINMENKFQDLFENSNSKAHYSKEMFYKFLPPSMFPQYDKIMIADVDVVYLNDVSKNFIEFDIDEDYYLSGHKAFCLKNSWLEAFYQAYENNFSQEEIAKLQTNACYWIFNLKKMREDHIEKKFIEYAINNTWRIIQPEQDVINLICYPKIKFLPVNSIVCTYVYDLFKTEEDFNNDLKYNSDEIKFAMDNPIQLHYATHVKPWNNLSSTKADIWFKYLAKTNFLSEYLQTLDDIHSLNSSIEVKKLLDEIKSIKVSKSYRLGRTILAPLRAVRFLLGYLIKNAPPSPLKSEKNSIPFLIEDNFDNSIDVLFKNFEYGEFIINNKSRKYLKNVNADQGVTEQALSLLCEKYPENRKKIKILNVGCGRKSQMSFLETLGFESFGIDFDIKEDTANIKFHDLNTQDNIPFENETFDCVICQEIIEHLENPWLLMRKVKKVLKVGGILILTTPNICSNQSKDIFCNNTNGFFIYFDPVNLWQHINPIPYWEMRHILTYNGFSIKKISGANEYYLNYIPNEENPSEQIRNEFSIQNNNVIIYLCENNHNNIKLYCPIPTYNYVWGK